VHVRGPRSSMAPLCMFRLIDDGTGSEQARDSATNDGRSIDGICWSRRYDEYAVHAVAAGGAGEINSATATRATAPSPRQVDHGRKTVHGHCAFHKRP
jgi:hypothetical protein